MGFSDAGCYGGEIQTPNLDRLAANGLRFTQFYNTARCWPTRSSLLTGYYAQQIGMDPPKGPLPPWTRVLPHYLKPLGYRCYHSGKWHLMGAPKPVADGGFDHSYLFEDWDRYFSPSKHFEDDRQAAAGQARQRVLCDHRFRRPRHQLPEGPRDEPCGEPFFLYLAFTSPHFPLHALPEDIARYRDRYLEGWDIVREQRWQRLRQMGLARLRPAAAGPEVHPALLQARGLGAARPRRNPARGSLEDADARAEAVPGHEDGHPRRDGGPDGPGDRARPRPTPRHGRPGQHRHLLPVRQRRGRDTDGPRRGPRPERAAPAHGGRFCASGPAGPAPATRRSAGTRFGCTRAASPRR